MKDYTLRVGWLANRRLDDPDTYVLDVPGTTPPAAAPHLPLTRDDFHAIPDGLATRVSWDHAYSGGRETYRVAYSGYFGWSVVRDVVGGHNGDWYGAVVTSPHSYAAAVAYITNCIAPGRWWGGANITVDETV